MPQRFCQNCRRQQTVLTSLEKPDRMAQPDAAADLGRDVLDERDVVVMQLVIQNVIPIVPRIVRGETK